jgi:hypothetical protein
MTISAYSGSFSSRGAKHVILTGSSHEIHQIGEVTYASVQEFCREFFQTGNYGHHKIVIMSAMDPTDSMEQLITDPVYQNIIVFLKGNILVWCGCN